MTPAHPPLPMQRSAMLAALAAGALVFALVVTPRLAQAQGSTAGAMQAQGQAQPRPGEGPDALVKRVSDEMLHIVRTDPQVRAGNHARIREIIETRLAPHFDFARMTALAVGRGWRQATPAQQKTLTDQFRALLARTYANAFVQYRDQTIRVKPLRMPPGATETIVRTEIVRPGAQPVEIDYSMSKEGDTWRAYDVIVAGVSLVTNYRDEFGRQIQQGGIDGLIKALEAKNAAPPPAQ